MHKQKARRQNVELVSVTAGGNVNVPLGAVGKHGPGVRVYRRSSWKGAMQAASVPRLKSRLGAYLRRVRKGRLGGGRRGVCRWRGDARAHLQRGGEEITALAPERRSVHLQPVPPGSQTVLIIVKILILRLISQKVKISLFSTTFLQKVPAKILRSPHVHAGVKSHFQRDSNIPECTAASMLVSLGKQRT